MNAHFLFQTDPQQTRAFSSAWSDSLGAAIAAAAPMPGYSMSLAGEDSQRIIAAVNQGIDSRLEACFVPDRGDSFRFQSSDETQGMIAGSRLECNVSPQSIVVLVRRLIESGDPTAESLASSICQTLGIELV